MFLRSRSIQKIFLLGFMRLIPASFVELWSQSILNVHPSLLPLFPGLEAIEKSFQARAPMGVTIHHVTPEMDAGAVVAQSQVYENQHIPHDFKLASRMMTFREHYLVRRVGEKWN